MLIIKGSASQGSELSVGIIVYNIHNDLMRKGPTMFSFVTLCSRFPWWYSIFQRRKQMQREVKQFIQHSRAKKWANLPDSSTHFVLDIVNPRRGYFPIDFFRERGGRGRDKERNWGERDTLIGCLQHPYTSLPHCYKPLTLSPELIHCLVLFSRLHHEVDDLPVVLEMIQLSVRSSLKKVLNSQWMAGPGLAVRVHLCCAPRATPKVATSKMPMAGLLGPSCLKITQVSDHPESASEAGPQDLCF